MYVCTTYIQCPRRPEESARSHGTGVTDSYELPRGCWELNPGSLKDQSMFLSAELSLQPLKIVDICENDFEFWEL